MKGNVPTMADLAAAYQKALTQVASALQQQGSGKVRNVLTQFSTHYQLC